MINCFRYLLLFVPIFLLLGGCNFSKGKSDSKGDAMHADSSSSTLKLDTTVVGYTNTLAVTQVYVIKRDTVVVRQAPSLSAKFMEKAGYGVSYEMVEDLGDWVAVWSKERYPYSEVYEGKEQLVIAKRKVYLPKSAIGKSEDLKLHDGDISIASFVQVGEGDPKYYESGHDLKDYLSFELVSKQEYLLKKKQRADLVVRDTLAHPKQGRKLILSTTSQKQVVFEDSPVNAEESRAEYEYIGHIPLLHQYIVQGSYYESADYTLVDMYSGERTISMIDFPYVSPDGRYILALYTNPYESSEDIELYRIVGEKIDRMISISFPHWMAGNDVDDMFFGRDGYLYFPVFYNMVYWTEQGELSKPKQFMRMKIKNS